MNSILPTTPRGVLFDVVSADAAAIAKDYASVRNMPADAASIIEEVKADIAALKEANKNVSFDEATAKAEPIMSKRLSVFSAVLMMV